MSAFLTDGQAVEIQEPSIERRYAEYQQLVALAVEVFGSVVEADRWLSNPSPDLENRTPPCNP
jgi:uncharacterized protein (DUF2384 family)